MISKSINVAVALFALTVVFGQSPAEAGDGSLLGTLSALGGDLTGQVGGLANSITGQADQFAVSSFPGSNNLVNGGLLPNYVNVVGSITKPVTNLLGSITGGVLGRNGALSDTLHQALGGVSGSVGGDALSNNLRLATGAVEGISTGVGAGLVDTGRAQGIGLPIGQNAAGMNARTISGTMLHKREAIADSLMANSVGGVANGVASAASMGGALGGAMGGAASSAMSSSMGGALSGPMSGPIGGLMGGPVAFGDPAAAQLGAASAVSTAATTANEAETLGSGLGAGIGAGLINNAVTDAGVAAASGALSTANAAANNEIVSDASAAGAAFADASGPQAGEFLARQAAGRQVLAYDAMRNAQAEAAQAGSEMIAHGANNARSASLASNAYRQARLANARDRVNIAGTIQNSARISDAAIATHDAATKAEDSLLGSELAVDSAATVLDSDAAYIPPVTSSLLRTLPYGRLGLRNIIPKPLTYASPYLPDVWLNGKPVNYLNVPLSMYPYAFGPAGPYSKLNYAAGLYNPQPFISNNGLFLSEMVYDPAYAYMTGLNAYGAVKSSMLPLLANAQLEAQDEVAMANMLTMQQLNGAGMGTTYQGYGRYNSVPMITGSVSDVTIMPTTTIGTTYPIGSALVIEPRDSYFQDYNDNASSRQNMDERQQ